MLLQSCPLEVTEADKPRGWHETVRGEAAQAAKSRCATWSRRAASRHWPGARHKARKGIYIKYVYIKGIDVSVFVLDRSGKPLMPCSEKRARKLLAADRARVHRLFPFAIRLVDRRVETSDLQPMRLALDPGSKVTGIALARVEQVSDPSTGELLDPVMHIGFLMELTHRGAQIKKDLQSRSALRRGRRSRNLRYRAPRFNNRTKPQVWLPPSLRHRVQTSTSWVRRIRGLAPVTHLAQELVRFDMQAMQAADDGRTIEGVDYQRGTLAGYELGEYLLAKWNRTCAYCDAKEVPLEKEHIVAKSRSGSDRVSNLTLSCRPCNQKKSARDVREFLAKEPLRLKRILAQAKAPLKDAAAVNSTRWALLEQLRATGLPVETASGGRTKFNRARLGIPKTHALDAACVGAVADVRRPAQVALQVKCMGRGSRSRTRNDAFGFPRGYLMREKSVKGFRTGDMVRATVPTGKKAGTHTGRVAVRATGSFNIQTPSGVVQGIGHKHCVVLMRGDGYSYSRTASAGQTKERTREAGHAIA
jgi:5-methylcytosine-specific restriction endonuclease McrA